MPHSRDNGQGLYKFVWSSGGEFDTFPKKVSITTLPPVPDRGDTMVDHAFFHTATLKICEQLDLGRVFENCFALLNTRIPLNCLNCHLFDPDNNTQEIIAWASDNTMRLPATGQIDLSEAAKSEILTNGDRLMHVNAIAESNLAQDFAQALGVPELSSINLPLQLKDRRLGMIGIMNSKAHAFTPDQIDLFKTLWAPFSISVANHLQYRELLELKTLLQDDNQYLQKELNAYQGEPIVGDRTGLRPVMELVRQVAPLENNILILGETGVGKEIIANRLHYSSSRHQGPFIKVNCGAIPETLIDSELFGHEKGAFTGAQNMKRGRFERAHNGTLFLDEVGELPQAAQVRLLRVLQEKQIERVGGSRNIQLNVRVIAATHRNLEAMVKENKFREDLWYRLNVFPIQIPPPSQPQAGHSGIFRLFYRPQGQRIEHGALADHSTRYPGTAPGL